MRASAPISPHRVTARGALAGATIALALSGVAGFAATCPAAEIVVAQNQPEAPAQPSPIATPNQDQPENGPKAPDSSARLPPNDATSVLGKKVKGPKGEDLGLVVDVLVNSDGRPRAAVIDFGGFLGVGSRKIAIDWKSLDFMSLARAGAVELGLDREHIAAAPEYKPGAPGTPVVTTPPAPPPVDADK